MSQAKPKMSVREAPSTHRRLAQAAQSIVAFGNKSWRISLLRDEAIQWATRATNISPWEIIQVKPTQIVEVSQTAHAFLFAEDEEIVSLGPFSIETKSGHVTPFEVQPLPVDLVSKPGLEIGFWGQFPSFTKTAGSALSPWEFQIVDRLGTMRWDPKMIVDPLGSNDRSERLS